jgi:hypothetical protein
MVVPPQLNGYSNVEKSTTWRTNHEYFHFLEIKESPKLCNYKMKDYRSITNSQKLRNVDEKNVLQFKPN